MDPSTSDFIYEKALRYGLHSCPWCQDIIVDLTSVALPGTKCNEVNGQESCGVEEALPGDKSVSLYYKGKLLHQYNFSTRTIYSAAPLCPFFQRLEDLDNTSDWPINIDKLSHKEDANYDTSLHLRLPTEIMSLVSDFRSNGPRIDPCIDTDKTFERARDLLNKCLREHQRCKQSGTPPTRLLDVRQDKIKLIDTATLENPTWAALSYCWGGPQEAQTTHVNIQHRYEEVPLQDLPLTIRDAIHTCRQMHVPFLWIDSLCIIQTEDNTVKTVGELDKDRELRKMAGIYSGAVLTISASCSSSAEEGFLKDREVWQPGVALPVRVNETYDAAQLFALPTLLQYSLEDEPVDDRAWIFQEKTLSGRKLNFRTHSLQWECHVTKTFVSHDGEYDFPTINSDRSYDAYGWRILVEEYSRRNLTDLGDKPIAIAAVAEDFSNVSEDLTTSDYIAGLWKPNLLNDLLWYNDFHEDDSVKLQGPSWSWTTIFGWIAFDHHSNYNTTATIISSEVDLADPKFIFGAAKSGRIRVKGLMTRVYRHVSSYQEGLLCKWDRDHEAKVVFFLELAVTGDGGILVTREEPKRHGLMLRRGRKPGEFVRAGYFSEKIHTGCESLRNVSCKRCTGVCECKLEVLNGSCTGWTCNREERVISIV